MCSHCSKPAIHTSCYLIMFFQETRRGCRMSVRRSRRPSVLLGTFILSVRIKSSINLVILITQTNFSNVQCFSYFICHMRIEPGWPAFSSLPLWCVCGRFVRPPLIMLSVDGFRASYVKRGSAVIPNIEKLSKTWRGFGLERTMLMRCFMEHEHQYTISKWFDAVCLCTHLRVSCPLFSFSGTCGTHAPYMRPVYPSKTFPNLYSLATVRHRSTDVGINICLKLL